MSDDHLNNFSETATVDGVDTDLLISQSSMTDKMEERNRLNQEIERFLAVGGTINEVDDDVMGDPPRKPENKYGSHPI
ncbi:MAG: hypothetical protein ACI8VC_002419 [Candidatus Endobugula sp.]|jgi:hypothetical protein